MSRFAKWIAPLIALIALPALGADPQALKSDKLGLEIWHLEESAVPMVALEISFPRGAALDPDDRLGLAHFLSGMLDEGAGEMDSRAFNEAAALLGLRLSFDAGQDGFSLSARMLSDKAAQSASLINAALTRPRFDEEPLRRVRGQILSGLASDEKDPETLARDAFFAAIFPDDPYGRNREGTPESIAAITADDLRDALTRIVSLEGAVIGVVGDISGPHAITLVETVLDGAPDTAPPPPPQTTPQFPGGEQVISFDSPQSSMVFGQPGPLRADPDYIPLYVLNHILGGGGFSARLTEEVREKRGLAYSVYAYLAPHDRAGLWIGGVGTANARASESVEVIRKEWRRMREEGVSADALEKAKRNLTGAWALRFDSNSEIARFLVGAQRAELPLDYIRSRNELIEAVTPADIARVAAKWMDPARLTFVIAGKPEGLSSTQ